MTEPAKTTYEEGCPQMPEGMTISTDRGISHGCRCEERSNADGWRDK